MRIETERLVIRDLERKDQEQLYKIVWQKNAVRFMRDRSDQLLRLVYRPSRKRSTTSWRNSGERERK